MHWTKLLSDSIAGKKSQNQSDSSRSIFERDYDRIVFSHPFRRLQDKTQVFPLPEQDFVHTRLTHSLEVSSVGRSLGKKVGDALMQRYPELAEQHYSAFDFGAIVAAASLTHDLGNPPFGHSGEDAISDFFLHHPVAQPLKEHLSEKEWADLTHFEGNAQGFRLLNKGSYQGLRLTAATMAAFTKYPRESLIASKDPLRCSQKKYGFFQSERQNFIALAKETGLLNLGNETDVIWVRHPLAFLVEAADDICYHLIDLEDGCRLGLVSLEETIALMASVLQERFDPDKLQKITDPEEKIGLLRALSIGVLIEQCESVFLQHEKAMLEGTFDKPLTTVIEGKAALDKIREVSIARIYRSRIVLETEVAGFEVISGILEAIVQAVYAKMFTPDKFTAHRKSIIRLLPVGLQEKLNTKDPTPYETLMETIDFVSSMTDSYALTFYRRLKGIALPGKG